MLHGRLVAQRRTAPRGIGRGVNTALGGCGVAVAVATRSLL